MQLRSTLRATTLRAFSRSSLLCRPSIAHAVLMSCAVRFPGPLARLPTLSVPRAFSSRLLLTVAFFTLTAPGCLWPLGTPSPCVPQPHRIVAHRRVRHAHQLRLSHWPLHDWHSRQRQCVSLAILTFVFQCPSQLLTCRSPFIADTAEGFTVAQIEANPPAFFADTHTAEFTAGAIRGQLELVESAY